MFTHLKICGLTTDHDARAVADLGVHFLGFNFYPASKRYIEPQRAAEIIDHLPPECQPVGILVRPTLSQCLDVLQVSRVKYLQIYEPLDFSDFALLPVPVIAAYRIRVEESFRYQAHNERFVLVDGFHPSEYGGTGRCLDWRRLPADVPKEKLILAGGITPDNILEALNTVNPAMVDVASGAERAPGLKDLEKVRSLQKAVLTFNIFKMNRLQHWLLK